MKPRNPQATNPTIQDDLTAATAATINQLRLQPITPTDFVRSPNNYDPIAWSDHTGLRCEDPSLAQQQFKEESDINYIAERYGLTGEMPQIQQLPSYGDYTGVFDFQTAMDAVTKARNDFMLLPAKLRTRFDNDPGKLLHFLNDPENRQEAEFLGLVTKPQENNDGNRKPGGPEATQRATNEETRAPGAQRRKTAAQGPQEPGPKATGDGGGGDQST